MPFSSLRPKNSDAPRCEQNSSIRPACLVSRNARSFAPDLDPHLRAVRSAISLDIRIGTQ
jgi:hypothetical protein